MSSAPGRHAEDHVESLFLYALRALPPSEISAVDDQIAACTDCRDELERLGSVVRSFVAWPADVLRPPDSLRERLARRIAAETGKEQVLPAPQRWAEPEWADAAPGISCKLLATDTEKQRVSMLVRLAPGTDYPPHRHAGVEELHLLHGELMVDDKKLYPGDYIRADAGSTDRRVWSETGCTCVLLTSTQDVIL
jgi:anti-sigma factor ChrR (cupin superfamily)